jgi:hypothetical protein
MKSCVGGCASSEKTSDAQLAETCCDRAVREKGYLQTGRHAHFVARGALTQHHH